MFSVTCSSSRWKVITHGGRRRRHQAYNYGDRQYFRERWVQREHPGADIRDRAVRELRTVWHRRLQLRPGDIHVTTSSGDVINSGSSGINASNQSTSIAANQGAMVTVSAAGSIHSGTINNNSGALPSGITAGFLGGTSTTPNLNVNGTVIVNNAANITADAGYGINAYNYGNGDITVNDACGTTVSGALYGIDSARRSRRRQPEMSPSTSTTTRR